MWSSSKTKTFVTHMRCRFVVPWFRFGSTCLCANIWHLLFCVMPREMIAKNALARKLQRKKTNESEPKRLVIAQHVWVPSRFVSSCKAFNASPVWFWKTHNVKMTKKLCARVNVGRATEEEKLNQRTTNTCTITMMSYDDAMHTRDEKVYFISILLFIFRLPK